MSLPQLKYIGFYDKAGHEQNRTCFLSARNKMDYILAALNRAGWRVTVVSPSTTQNRRAYAGTTLPLPGQNQLLLFPTTPAGGLLRKVISVLARNFFLLRYLLLHTKKGEPILVYHSLAHCRLLVLAKKIKRFRLILEVEELYGDVTGKRADTKKEYKAVAAADAFLFSTELLHEKLNPTGKPYAVCYGPYAVEPVLAHPPQDGKIHAVYAGTFDPRKGGLVAAQAAEHLDERYHIHIIGFGREEEVQALQQTIRAVSGKTACALSYGGLLDGDDYKRFLQRCSIGLCTQAADAGFANTSFPSKVLSYMNNGLHVVSTAIPALTGSQIGGYLAFCEQNTPQAVAAAIRAVDPRQKQDARAVIRRLDKEFTARLRAVLAGPAGEGAAE